MIQKRYQYWTKEGIKWTSWFKCSSTEEALQLKGFKGNNLKNEYRKL
jgi:hypothetical protein